MKKFICLLLVIPLLSGCIKIGNSGDFFYLVKFKADYADNAIAFDFNNGNGSSCYYIPYIPKKLPLKLAKKYCLFDNMSHTVVVLSISREEAVSGTFTGDSIASLIIDDDPIEELWFRDEQGHRRRFSIDCWDSDCCPFDTAALNEVIVAGKLKRYFERVK